MELNTYLGNCINQTLIELIFGSVSEFARLIEEKGDNFTVDNIRVIYDENKDIHSLYEIE